MVEKFTARIISQPLGSRTPGPGGEAARAWAEPFAEVARVTGAMADRAAEAEGVRQGAVAGLDPNFQPTRKDTIYGRSFDAAALRTASAQLDNKVRTELAGAYTAFKHDPIEFNKAVEKIHKDNISKLPPELQPQWAESLQRQRFPYDQEIARTRAELTLKEDAATYQDWAAQNEVDLGRMAYQSGISPEAIGNLAAHVGSIEEKLIHYGPKEAFTFHGKEYAADPLRAGLLSPEAMAETMIALKETSAFHQVKGAFDRTKGLTGKNAFMEKFRADYLAGEGVAKNMTPQTVDKLETWMEGEVRQAEADARAAQVALRAEIADIRSNLSDYRPYISQGILPPAGDYQALLSRARATGNKEIIREVEGLGNLMGKASQAAKASPLQLQGWIAERRFNIAKNGATPDEAAELMMLENTANGMSTGLKRDPMKWAQRSGVTPGVPLEVVTDADGNVQVNPQSLKLRAQEMRKVQGQYGVPFHPFMEEDLAIFGAVEKAGGPNMAALAGQFVQAFGSDAKSALEQLSPHAPALAHMGGMLSQGSSLSVVNDAARGYQLLAGADGVSTGLGADANLRARTLLEPLQNVPELRAQAERAGRAIYVGRKGLNATYDEKEFDKAIHEGLGATFINNERYGGIAEAGQAGGWWWSEKPQVLAPTWMKASDLGGVVANLSPGDYYIAGGGRGPVDAEGRAVPLKTLQSAKLLTLDSGVYELQVQEHGEWVSLRTDNPRAKGGVYQLDLNKLQHKLRGDQMGPPE